MQLTLQNKLITLDKQIVLFNDLGLIEYKEAWDYQEVLFKQNVEIKSILRNKEIINANQVNSNDSLCQQSEKDVLPKTTHYLLFCEHSPVLTLGKSGHEENILISKEEMARQGIQYFKTNRGGDITFHGPQQIVGYPIIDLEMFFTDIGKYLRSLEEVIILTLEEYEQQDTNRRGRLKLARGAQVQRAQRGP